MAQQIWEVQVEKAAKSVLAAAEKEGDFRPRIKDLNSGHYFLIDTGACTSVYPKKWCPDAILDSSRGLQAVNGSTISTYGTKSVNIRLNRKQFPQKMTIASINQPILGWDWLVKHWLDLIWTHNKCTLYSGKTKSTYPLHLGKVDSDSLNLAPIDLNRMSFKQWSNKHKCAPKPQPIPPKYEALFNEYPEVLAGKMLEEPLHGIVHEIDTGSATPC